MKNIITILLLVISFSSCAPERDCADLKIGKFRYTKPDLPILIIRSESMQIETNTENNVIIKTAIAWTSECSYILTYTDIQNYPTDISHLIGTKIYCEVLETSGDRTSIHAKSDTIDEQIELRKVN